MLLLRRIRAFIIRDFHLAMSYQLEFFLNLTWILGIVTTFFFISRIFASQISFYEQWKEPLPAWLTGMAMLSFFLSGFSSLANAIRQEQMLTPINVPTVVLASSAWAYVSTTFFSFLYLFFGWLFFNVQYHGNYLLALMFLVLTTAVLACLGILSASFAMVFKRGDPFAILLGAGTAIFSGVFFPKEMLTEALGETGGKTIAFINPSTHGLDGIRAVLIEGKGLSEVETPLITLLCFLIVLLPFSLWIFGRAIAKAKQDGSLIQY
jgi:ABC-2 type transport system permease protein